MPIDVSPRHKATPHKKSTKEMWHQSTHQTSQLESLAGGTWHWLEPRDHAGSVVLLVMFQDVVLHHPC